MKKSEKSYTGWYFLIVVILAYIAVAFLNVGAIIPSLQFALNIIKTIFPVSVLIFSLTAIVNYFITPTRVIKHLGKSSGLKRWFFAIVGGIISTGPIYMWYPMLKELKKRGVNYGFIAAFLYNRAIKLPLIPLIIFYFGLKFTVVLTVVMIIMSIIQGIIFEEIEEGGFL